MLNPEAIALTIRESLRRLEGFLELRGLLCSLLLVPGPVGRDLGVDGFAVVVVVDKSCINVSKGQVGEIGDDLLGAQVLSLMQDDQMLHLDSGAGNPWLTAADFGRAGNVLTDDRPDVGRLLRRDGGVLRCLGFHGRLHQQE